LDPNDTGCPNNNSQSPQIIIIIAFSVFGFVVLVVAILCIFLCIRRRRKSANDSKTYVLAESNSFASSRSRSFGASPVFQLDAPDISSPFEAKVDNDTFFKNVPREKPETDPFGDPEALYLPKPPEKTQSIMIQVDKIPSNLPENTMLIVERYVAKLDDELQCEPGDWVVVLKEFDDGWSIGYNRSRMVTGMFPMVCAQLLSAVMQAAQGQMQSNTHLEPKDPRASQVESRTSSLVYDKEVTEALQRVQSEKVDISIQRMPTPNLPTLAQYPERTATPNFPTLAQNPERTTTPNFPTLAQFPEPPLTANTESIALSSRSGSSFRLSNVFSSIFSRASPVPPPRRSVKPPRK
jgi:hypothetical protein